MEYKIEHLEQLLDMMCDPIYLWGAERTQNYMNQAGEMVLRNHTGVASPKEFFNGKSMGQVWNHAWQADMRAFFSEVKRTKKPFKEVYPVMHNGLPHTMQVYMYPIVGEDGALKSVAAMYTRILGELFTQDIVEKKYRGIGDNHPIRVEPLNIENNSLIKNIIERFSYYTGCEYFNLHQFCPKSNVITTYSTTPFTDGLFMNIENDEVLDRKLEKILKQENRYIKPVEMIKDENRKALLLEQEIGYIGTYPLRCKGELLGILSIGYEAKQYQNYGTDIMVHNMCNKIALLINNIALVEGLKKEFTKRQQVYSQRKMFFDVARDYIAILNEAGMLKRVNNVWIEELGYTPAELEGHSLFQFVAKKDLHTAVKILSSSFGEKKIQEEGCSLVGKNHEIHLVEWRITNGVFKGQSVIVLVGRDVTRTKEADKKRYELSQELERERAKNQFFSTISHEFKTPLNIILSASYVVQNSLRCDFIRNKEKQKFERYLQHIRINAYQTLRKANNLIDLTKIDAGNFELHYEHYNLVEIVEEITLSIAQNIEKKGIKVFFHTEEEEVIVKCDYRCIERIVFNLLVQSIRCIASNRVIWVCLKTTGNKAIVAVKNLDVDFKEWTKRYEQLDAVSKHLVHALLKLHDTKLYIEPQLAEIHFSLPQVELMSAQTIISIQDKQIEYQEKCNIELCDIF